MQGKCWNCGKMNEENANGDFWCSCRNIPEGSNGGMVYLPLDVYEKRKEMYKAKNQKLIKQQEINSQQELK